MATTGYTEIIDRSILWKKAMEKKYGTYDEVVILVVEKIDKMLKESQESGQFLVAIMTYLQKHWVLPNTVVEYELKASIIHHTNNSIPWRIVLCGNL
ncbi:hypothetical protein CK203_108825 [Vitis vinifera]|uniref:Uncharacterized protein n=1 Tax=Vitis vinifera TaxID=29760 RepID=A0A438CE08_VITVI|nr:hypothetical protein CK203_108825 [Vitis vinifera]